MSEQEFAEHLISVGWDRAEAEAEAAAQYRGEAGDCDGDMEL